jgi:hypothetical protein
MHCTSGTLGLRRIRITVKRPSLVNQTWSGKQCVLCRRPGRSNQCPAGYYSLSREYVEPFESSSIEVSTYVNRNPLRALNRIEPVVSELDPASAHRHVFVDIRIYSLRKVSGLRKLLCFASFFELRNPRKQLLSA